MNSVIIMTRNPRIFYAGDGVWTTKLDGAKLFPNSLVALRECKALHLQVFVIVEPRFVEDTGNKQATLTPGGGKSAFITFK